MVEERRIANKGAGLRKGLAKIVRVLTVPPVMIGGLFLWFYFATPMFRSVSELLFAMLFLAVIPSLAYPLSLLLPKIRQKGREGQRKLAFVLSLVGYTGAMIYGAAVGVKLELALVFLTYFLSVVILSVCNKLKFRASGHGCGVTGPLLLPAYYIHPLFLLAGGLVLALVYDSSLVLKRHTLRELLCGSGVAVLSFFLSLLLLSL